MKSHRVLVALVLTCLIGCAKHASSSAPATAPSAQAKPVASVIRIHAASDKPITDSAGNVWQPGTGFKDGDITDRDPAMEIANTKDPAMYRLERYSLTSFAHPLPNGKYTVRLYFAETFEEITDAKQRIFSIKVEDVELKDLDIFVKAGGRQKAHIESVPVEIKDGELTITFEPKEQNTMINALEIVPGS